MQRATINLGRRSTFFPIKTKKVYCNPYKYIFENTALNRRSHFDRVHAFKTEWVQAMCVACMF